MDKEFTRALFQETLRVEGLAPRKFGHDPVTDDDCKVFSESIVWDRQRRARDLSEQQLSTPTAFPCRVRATVQSERYSRFLLPYSFVELGAAERVRQPGMRRFDRGERRRSYSKTVASRRARVSKL